MKFFYTTLLLMLFMVPLGATELEMRVYGLFAGEMADREVDTLHFNAAYGATDVVDTLSVKPVVTHSRSAGSETLYLNAIYQQRLFDQLGLAAAAGGGSDRSSFGPRNAVTHAAPGLWFAPTDWLKFGVNNFHSFRKVNGNASSNRFIGSVLLLWQGFELGYSGHYLHNKQEFNSFTSRFTQVPAISSDIRSSIYLNYISARLSLSEKVRLANLLVAHAASSSNYYTVLTSLLQYSFSPGHSVHAGLRLKSAELATIAGQPNQQQQSINLLTGLKVSIFSPLSLIVGAQLFEYNDFNGGSEAFGGRSVTTTVFNAAPNIGLEGNWQNLKLQMSLTQSGFRRQIELNDNQVTGFSMQLTWFFNSRS